MRYFILRYFFHKLFISQQCYILFIQVARFRISLFKTLVGGVGQPCNYAHTVSVVDIGGVLSPSPTFDHIITNLRVVLAPHELLGCPFSSISVRFIQSQIHTYVYRAEHFPPPPFHPYIHVVLQDIAGQIQNYTRKYYVIRMDGETVQMKYCKTP